MDRAENIHATAVVLGDRGVMILGPSGSGKSRLAHVLIRRATALGRFAALVGDDQLLVTASAGRLLARAPAPIRGLIEVRGFGPAAIGHEPAAVIDRAVRLVPAAEAPRIGDDTAVTVAGVAVPCLMLAERDAGGAATAVLAWIDAPPALIVPEWHSA